MLPVKLVASTAMLPTGELEGGGRWDVSAWPRKPSWWRPLGIGIGRSSRVERTKVLDEFVTVTGDHRKHAIPAAPAEDAP